MYLLRIVRLSKLGRNLHRCLSMNKSQLVQSSRNIEEILQSTDENNCLSQCFSREINEIHREYPWKKLATSTKNLYQKTSSKFNEDFLRFEIDRLEQKNIFHEKSNLLLRLKYIRYLEISSIYRYITFDVHQSIEKICKEIYQLTENEKDFPEKSLQLICELCFFVKYLSNEKGYSQTKCLLSKTFIANYLSNYLFERISKETSLLLIEELCSTLYSIRQICSISIQLMEYLLKNQSNSLKILEYLILIQHHSIDNISKEYFSLLNEYLLQIGIHQIDLHVICQFLILIASFKYSHQVFLENLQEKLFKEIRKSSLNDPKLNCQLIYYLCLTDPTNRFHSRTIIVELSQLIRERIVHPKWIVQAQHGMMFVDIYQYELLFSILQQKSFPLLIQDFGDSSLTIYRQLFDIHHALMIDRPTLQNRLLNPQILSFATKITNEYRSKVRPTQKAYNQFLQQLNDAFNQIYGKQTSKIINTDQDYPFILFDFLELNLPDRNELKAIGINPKQRIAILPLLNSMFVNQQRSNGQLVRVLSAHTAMRYRLIEKNNYLVLPVFHREYLRAMQNQTLQKVFEKNLALKKVPYQFDSDDLS